MKKILLTLLFISTPVVAEWGTVIKTNVCKNNVIIKTDAGMFVVARHYGVASYQLQIDDKVHGRFFSQGIKLVYTDAGKYSRYWIVGYGTHMKEAETLACSATINPIMVD